ncbi:MAG: DUF3562 domain-containing protein [Nitrospirota bacterium]|jgi:hypothetical protein
MLYDDEQEKKQHIHAIQILSRDIGAPVEEISGIYEIELERLKHDAKVRTYLTVLVARRVKEKLKADH